MPPIAELAHRAVGVDQAAQVHRSAVRGFSATMPTLAIAELALRANRQSQ